MHKVKEHLEKLECLQDKVLSKIQTLDFSHDESAQDFFYMADIAKDIAEAMEKECKACYYKKVTEAMEEHKGEENPFSRMGYDNWRYASGRYAPTGKGHYAGHHGRSHGFTPNDVPMYDWDEFFEGAEIYDPTRIGMMPMGYTPEHPIKMTSQYGHDYDNYKMARKHYTETKSDKDRETMHHHAKEHMHGVEHTIRDIWKDADPSLRKELKAEMTSLVNEMTV